MPANRRVAVLTGAPGPRDSPDEQDTQVQAQAVSAALETLGWQPVPVVLSLDLEAARRRLLELRPAFAFNLVESVEGSGRLVHLATTLLDSLALPYSGCGTEAMLLTSDKRLAKRQLTLARIATPAWMEPEGRWMPAAAPGPGPWIVKSVWEHASLGLDDASLVADQPALARALRAQARRHGGDWFAETYIEGREFNLALLDGEPGPTILPIAEMRFLDYPPDKPRILDYAAKWHADSFEYRNTMRSFDLPAGDNPLLARMRRMARACWTLFRLRGYARVDFRVDGDGVPWVLEVNANPCLSPDAGFAAAAARAGLPFAALVERLLPPLPAAATASRPLAARPAVRKRRPGRA